MKSVLRAAPASLALCLAASLALGGCAGTKKALGLEKTAPDEFNIVARAPLSLPPDYSLRPPQPGALRPQDQTPTQQARQTVFRAGDQQAALPTPRGSQSVGELALLKQAGAANSDPSIRQTVNRETAAAVENDRSFVDSVLFWRKSGPAGDVIDPQKENQRLRENAALGKAPNEGETPVIQRKKRALLEGIF
jgi:Protein of unknown function (DUF3035)